MTIPRALFVPDRVPEQHQARMARGVSAGQTVPIERKRADACEANQPRTHRRRHLMDGTNSNRLSLASRAGAAWAVVANRPRVHLGRQVYPVTEEHDWRLGRVEDPFGHHWEIGKPLIPWPPADASSHGNQ